MTPQKYFEKLMKVADVDVNLAEAALQIAAEEYPGIDIASYLSLLDHWGMEIRPTNPRSRTRKRMERLHEWLFERMHFSGNVENYYDPKNSFLNDVIERKTGIPITLSVIYLDLAWRLGLEAAGTGFPGHFLIRVITARQTLFVDPFHKGKIMTADECVDFWNDISENHSAFQKEFLAPIGKKQILTRMLRNLKAIYLEQKNFSKLLTVLDKLVALNPDLPEEIRDRGIIYYEMRAFRLALRDFETFLSIQPYAEDAPVIQQYLQVLREYDAHMN